MYSYNVQSPDQPPYLYNFRSWEVPSGPSSTNVGLQDKMPLEPVAESWTSRYETAQRYMADGFGSLDYLQHPYSSWPLDATYPSHHNSAVVHHTADPTPSTSDRQYHGPSTVAQVRNGGQVACRWGGECSMIIDDLSPAGITRHLRAHHFAESSDTLLKWEKRSRGSCEWSNDTHACGRRMFYASFGKHIAAVHLGTISRRCPKCNPTSSEAHNLREWSSSLSFGSLPDVVREEKLPVACHDIIITRGPRPAKIHTNVSPVEGAPNHGCDVMNRGSKAGLAMSKRDYDVASHKEYTWSVVWPASAEMCSNHRISITGRGVLNRRSTLIIRSCAPRANTHKSHR
ncbi:hypothetical protein IEO21_02164 [Rhodonia placenta]|uniref:Uncharacterized protein n=1 Tax=Rhodonia placenta TaxID=104341 RepID=A0A8H7U5E1_9APHY|nr:hypothetical protein IEO21_02164 [Postia placenta]